MKTVTVDPQRRVRLGEEKPSTKFWVLPEPNGYRLERITVPETGSVCSKAQILEALDKMDLELTATWEEMRKATREID